MKKEENDYDLDNKNNNAQNLFIQAFSSIALLDMLADRFFDELLIESKKIIENRKKQNFKKTFPEMEDLVSLVNKLKESNPALKNLNYEEILSLSLLLRPFKMKTELENQSKSKTEPDEKFKIDDSIVAVYGARTFPIIRRVNALLPLKRNTNIDLSNGIIFSGGRSWTTIVQSDPKYQPSDDKIHAYLIDQEHLDLANFENMIKKLKTNPQTISNDEINELIKEVHKSEKLYDVLHKKYESNNNENLTFDAWLKKYLPNKLISDTYLENEHKHSIIKLFNPRERARKILWRQNLINEFKSSKFSQNVEQSSIMNEHFSDLSDLMLAREKELWEKELTEYKKNYPNDPEIQDINNYEDIVNNFFDGFQQNYLLSNIMHHTREADLMDLQFRKIAPELDIQGLSKPQLDENGHIMDEINPLPIIHDVLAYNSAENARNTIKEFLKLKNSNPKIKRLIIISEWPYLLRQVYTTIHIAKEEFGIDLDETKITGYPADFENKEFSIDTILNEFYKIADYPDVGYETDAIQTTNKKLLQNSDSSKISSSSYPKINFSNDNSIDLGDLLSTIITEEKNDNANYPNYDESENLECP